MEHRAMILVANLGNVSLSDTLSALADDHEEERAEHLRHCAKIFDVERTYRNYFVHGPYTFRSNETETDALAVSLGVRGGQLRAHSRTFGVRELDTFQERLFALQEYISELIQDSVDLRGGKPLSSLSKPAVAKRLAGEKTLVVAPDKYPPEP